MSKTVRTEAFTVRKSRTRPLSRRGSSTKSICHFEGTDATDSCDVQKSRTRKENPARSSARCASVPNTDENTAPINLYKPKLLELSPPSPREEGRIYKYIDIFRLTTCIYSHSTDRGIVANKFIMIGSSICSYTSCVY